MPGAYSLKSDESFLEKIAMGAIGTKRVLENLRCQGHDPIELERGSTTYKIWKSIKIKRFRLPDLLCTNCGNRFESRAKSKMTISMSHSLSKAERGWDYGLKDGDYVVIVTCKKSGDRPIDWTASDLVQYVSVADLRSAFNERQVVQERAKGAQEGFEVRLTWPTAIASYDATVLQVDNKSIRIERQSDRRKQSFSLVRKSHQLRPLVSQGSTIKENQVIAAGIAVSEACPCSRKVGQRHFIDLLKSPSPSDKFSGVKGLLAYDNQAVHRLLENVITDDREHIYVRLEAAATLLRHGQAIGLGFLRECLKSNYLEHRLEAVIVLGEISSIESKKTLIDCLFDEQQDTEVRAGAAWSLGEVGDENSIVPLVKGFQAMSLSIQTEAVRALAKLGRRHQAHLISEFSKAAITELPGLAWAIGKVGAIKVDDVLPLLNTIDKRQWTAFMIGTQKSEQIIGDIERLKASDPQVYFAVTVLWKVMGSWISNLEEY